MVTWFMPEAELLWLATHWWDVIAGVPVFRDL
jgi:hypothetical protein